MGRGLRASWAGGRLGIVIVPAFLLALLVLLYLPTSVLPEERPKFSAIESMFDEAADLITRDPALTEHSAALLTALEGLSGGWVGSSPDGLYCLGMLQCWGQDVELRPIFVHLQAVFEQTMTRMVARGQIEACGAIHTPTPATPCCTGGAASTELFGFKDDAARIHTVESRASIVRGFLSAGGRLAVVYPAAGMEGRSLEQMKAYRALLQSESKQLIDLPVESSHLPHDLVGATYLFWDRDGREYAFSIRAPQANAPSDEQMWGLWWGSADHPVIRGRVDRVRFALNELGVDPFER